MTSPNVACLLLLPLLSSAAAALITAHLHLRCVGLKRVNELPWVCVCRVIVHAVLFNGNIVKRDLCMDANSHE